jgi:hypothetical protein
MTPDEIRSLMYQENQQFTTQQQIFNARMKVLEDEKEKFKEERLDEKALKEKMQEEEEKIIVRP